MIDLGYLYVAQPPLYKIKKGKSLHYAYYDEEKDAILKDLGVEPEGANDIDEENDNEEVVAKKKSGKVYPND